MHDALNTNSRPPDDDGRLFVENNIDTLSTVSNDSSVKGENDALSGSNQRAGCSRNALLLNNLIHAAGRCAQPHAGAVTHAGTPSCLDAGTLPSGEKDILMPSAVRTFAMV